MVGGGAADCHAVIFGFDEPAVASHVSWNCLKPVNLSLKKHLTFISVKRVKEKNPKAIIGGLTFPSSSAGLRWYLFLLRSLRVI